MLKKYLIFSMGLIMSLMVAACQHTNAKVTPNHKPTVAVTTSFLEDIVNQVAGDLVTQKLIIPAGEDPHRYTAKKSDLEKLQTSDLILYHGLHFEAKMDKALQQSGVAVSKDFKKTAIENIEENGKTEIDPHFWFDIDLYKTAVITTKLELQKLLPKEKQEIESKTKHYLAELDKLDDWVKQELSSLETHQRYLVTPHDAFNYFAKRYHFTLHAPQGISTDSEVANSDMIETVNTIIDNNIKAIFTESTTNPSRMQKLQEAVEAKGGHVQVVSGEGQELLSDSLAPSGQTGDTYIEMYKHNINLITSHLK